MLGKRAVFRSIAVAVGQVSLRELQGRLIQSQAPLHIYYFAAQRPVTVQRPASAFHSYGHRTP